VPGRATASWRAHGGGRTQREGCAPAPTGTGCVATRVGDGFGEGGRGAARLPRCRGLRPAVRGRAAGSGRLEGLRAPSAAVKWGLWGSDQKGWAQRGLGLARAAGLTLPKTFLRGACSWKPHSWRVPAAQEFLWPLVISKSPPRPTLFPGRDSSGRQRGRAVSLPAAAAAPVAADGSARASGTACFGGGCPGFLNWVTQKSSLQVTGRGVSRFGFLTLRDAENLGKGISGCCFWQPRGRVVCSKCGKMNIKSLSNKTSDLPTKSKGMVFQVWHGQAPCKG